MKIPIDVTNDYSVGDEVILISPASNGYCLFLSGHKFKIFKYDKNYNTYYLKDADGDILKLYRIDNITKKIQMGDAKKKHSYKVECNYIKDFFSKNCPHKTEEYDHRDMYYKCGKVDSKYYECKPNINCLDYYNDIKKEDKRVENFIRTEKLKTILKK